MKRADRIRKMLRKEMFKYDLAYIIDVLLGHHIRGKDPWAGDVAALLAYDKQKSKSSEFVPLLQNKPFLWKPASPPQSRLSGTAFAEMTTHSFPRLAPVAGKSRMFP